ncbi:mannose-1-phosphate guanylyltransferase [bacterium]|nr:mannose-1-phosphate guanylyltransferase [bacterium]
MAGGSGTRFWPLSRRITPKQVLAINGPRTMMQETFDRLEDLIPPEKTYIVTNEEQVKFIAPQLPQLSTDNFILEPVGRNTAPCIGLAATHIYNHDPNGIMVVLPADHLIRNKSAFQNIVKTAINFIEEHDALVTIGIKPTRPETGYGYIQFKTADKNAPEPVHEVVAFAEKPDQKTAELFLQSGDFYWNSGMFIWRASRILSEMEEYLPEQYAQLQKIAAFLNKNKYQQKLIKHYQIIRPISIDYGIMEVTSSPIFMIEGNFDWSDVGSWDELYRISQKDRDGNVLIGETLTIDSENNYIYSPGKLTAVIGLNDILVVNTPTATLICPFNRAQSVKEVVEKLEKDKRDEYL